MTEPEGRDAGRVTKWQLAVRTWLGGRYWPDSIGPAAGEAGVRGGGELRRRHLCTHGRERFHRAGCACCGCPRLDLGIFVFLAGMRRRQRGGGQHCCTGLNAAQSRYRYRAKCSPLELASTPAGSHPNRS